MARAYFCNNRLKQQMSKQCCILTQIMARKQPKFMGHALSPNKDFLGVHQSKSYSNQPGIPTDIYPTMVTV